MGRRRKDGKVRVEEEGWEGEEGWDGEGRGGRMGR
jgi:hypothetical protein